MSKTLDAEVVEAQANSEEAVSERKELTEEERKEQEEKFFKLVDEKTEAVLETLKEQPLEVVLEVIAQVTSVVGEAVNIEKIKLLNTVAQIVGARYPEQHPLIKVVSMQTGKQAKIDFNKDLLFIMEDASKEVTDETPVTILNIASDVWVKNDLEIPKEKLDVITVFYRDSYPKHKEKFLAYIEEQEKAKKEQEEADNAPGDE